MNTAIRQQWLQERKTGIGGSDAAVILGISQWKTPYQLWLEKTGQSTDDDADSPAMYWGRTLEVVIRKHYQQETGLLVGTPPMLRHTEHEWMIANVDGLTENGKVLEIKTARSAEKWGETGTDEIPEAYQLQVQHYMAVTGLKAADVAVLIGGSDFRIYTINSDTELQNNLIKAEHAFWQMVQNKTPPKATSFTEMQAQWLSQQNKPQNSAIADAETLRALAELRQLRHEIKDAQNKEEQYKLQIAQYMHNAQAETLTDEQGKTLATNKPTKSAMRFDAKHFEEDNPETYQSYLKPSAPQMRLLIKN